MSEPTKRQFNPPGLPPLPPPRLFKVTRPVEAGGDVYVEATSLGIEADGVLKFVELVYMMNPVSGDYEMMQFVRRLFREWTDVEEIAGMPRISAGQAN